jgi:hypothetical protein
LTKKYSRCKNQRNKVSAVATIGDVEGRVAMLEQNLTTAAKSASVSLCLSLGLVFLSPGHAAAAEDWNFYMHQSAPNFVTSRGAKLFTEEIEKATNGELKVRLHLAGTLQINASNVTQAVGRECSTDWRRFVQFGKHPGGGHFATADAY